MKSSAGSPIFVLAAAFLVLAAGVAWMLWQILHVADTRSRIHEPRIALRPRTPWKNTQPHVQYVGDAACVRCHAEIADTFRRHPMGRSLGSVAAAPKSPTARRNSRPVTPATPSKLAGDMSFIARPAWTSGVKSWRRSKQK